MVWVLLHTVGASEWPLGDGLMVQSTFDKTALWAGLSNGEIDDNPLLIPGKENPVSERTIDCNVECVNGCILGDDCPHRSYQKAASEFIQSKSVDQMLEIAEERLKKQVTQSSVRPFPELPDLPNWSN
jgi:hypothetical protein